MALFYLKQSLSIRQQIGDGAGLAAGLFNMGVLHWQSDEKQEAYSVWLKAYQIARQIRQADVLQALTNLAPQIGMVEGLAGWEELARKSKDEG